MGWMKGRCNSIRWIAMAWGESFSRVVTCLTGTKQVRQVARAVLVAVRDTRNGLILFIWFVWFVWLAGSSGFFRSSNQTN